MNQLSTKILGMLKKEKSIISSDLDDSQSDIHSSLISLSSRDLVEYDTKEIFLYSLSQEGAEIFKNGSYEFNLYKSIPDSGIEIVELDKHKLGKVNAFKNKWIRKDGDRVYRNVDVLQDTVRKYLENVNSGIYNENEISILKKRKLIVQSKGYIYTIKRGKSFGLDIEYVTELTSRMVIDGTYKNYNFKPYNFDTKGNIKTLGALHPLLKVKEEIRKIFLEMGFVEMRTNQFVESSFWNFDALFQPQQHPSRDAHDTFYMKSPALTSKLPEGYLEKVKNIHTNGDFGSDGYFHKWEESEARKNILRSHTTSVSAKYLKELADKKITSAKLFSIDKVFRNESLDSTHLAEFNQVEGVILGKNLNIGNLMAVMEKFFLKLGISDIKFKPAYNPYTEPSMEVFGYHEGLKKWIEIGNSGMFRPEMLRTMGFDEDVRAIGYGLSLERPTMIKYNISNIRDLVGHKVDLEFIKKSEFCFF